MTYSIDFRKKVLEVRKKEGISFEGLSKRFCISKTTILSWTKRLTPKKKRNKGASKINMEALREDIKSYPDAYLYERAERMQVSKNGIWWALSG